jgi:hypothetical protein
MSFNEKILALSQRIPKIKEHLQTIMDPEFQTEV